MLRKTALLLLLGMLVPMAWGQTSGAVPVPAAGALIAAAAGAEDSIPTIRKSVEEVNLIFTATDKRGRFKKNLKPSELVVYDDGKPPAALRSFRSQTDLPLRVGLVLDVSGSITSRFTFEQQAAIRFFNQILRPDTDRAFVVAFKSTPTLTQDFTDSPDLLASGVKKYSAGGGSAVYDALHLAAKKLMGAQADRPVRRLIILLSDGEDNQSRTTTNEVIEAARRAEVAIYAISTSNSNIFSRGDKLMDRFAEETGGQVFYPNKIEDVAHAFSSIQEELRSQYALSYKPADFNADGRYRRIYIQARNDKSLVIRARKGYFAPVR